MNSRETIKSGFQAGELHQVFGEKENAEYTDREGAYLIPVCGSLVGVIRTPKGYFLPGGGLENGESHIDCIKREFMEEAGCTVLVGKKICSAETYCRHPVIGYFHPIQTYYIGKILKKTAEPSEKDHELMWIEYEKIRGNMFAEMQNWALEQLSGQISDEP